MHPKQRGKSGAIWLRTGLAGLSALLVTACANGGAGSAGPAPGPLPSVAVDAATDSHPRRPVIVVPDIGVSRLVGPDDDQVVWDSFAGISPNPFLPEAIRAIALPMAEGRPLAELTDDLRAEPVSDATAGAYGFDAGANLHAGVTRALTEAGYRPPGASAVSAPNGLFVFAYDWRRDLVENARALARFIDGRVGPGRAVDLVGEGAGALIVRYFLLYGDQDLPEGGLPEARWSGAARVERAILIAPPNAGTVSSLLRLIQGDAAGRLTPAVIGTFPSAYQLLPRPRHGAVRARADGRLQNHLDPELWRQAGWGLAGASDEDLATLLPEAAEPAARRRSALAYQARSLDRAGRFMQALDRADTVLPEGLDLHLMTGDGQSTPLRLGYDPGGARLDVIETTTGDGAVPRASALLDERLTGMGAPAVASPIPWRSVHLFNDDAIGMAGDPAFADNLRFLLVETPDSPWDGRFEPAPQRQAPAGPAPAVVDRPTEGPRRLF
ncbi:esterase/lipase family protein [Marinivivus vitaminiproducens]|uniref:esterase/lipase family protein n=1 Tax=Marinivivus vitaminiproducens TaxID=3035935 RepID=UPI0027A38A52|nr:hypothetical protein P4R82_12685 [Geminicoccaceae bacterium SCSIO 64248]